MTEKSFVTVCFRPEARPRRFPEDVGPQISVAVGCEALGLYGRAASVCIRSSWSGKREL